MLVTIVVLFALCWLPLQTFLLLYYFVPGFDSLDSDHDRKVYALSYFACHWLANANSMVNPFVYCFMSDNFREELKTTTVGDATVETLAHVLGSCSFGETLRNSRHHKIRSTIAICLKSNGYTTFEEVHGIADTGSHRRIDIITFKLGETKGYILDPTIRFETHQNQPEEGYRSHRINDGR
ncbi:hypothetical protein ANN_11588 [Periplaneta americana]|uniref:G-protein coupled receptors family 1 profile domain-containing protein n=1 Tax=Periplaneta americana TaxID=6978 RepID=A0ABQ8T5F8_PERAM|nr:hypothetical protein ANN_11588 [Periplaneta americana]